MKKNNEKPFKKLFLTLWPLFGILVCAVLSVLIVPASVAAADEEIATFDMEEEAAFDAEPVETVRKDGTVATGLMHADHYHPPEFFPERVKRSLKTYPWVTVIPFAMLVIMALLTTQFRGKRRRQTMSAGSRGRLSNTAGLCLCLCLSLVLVTSATVGISNALTYSSVKDAVVSFLGEGKKIYQTSINITPERKQVFAKELKWIPRASTIKAYYSKNSEGAVEAYAFVLSDKLPQCGGLHKYCIKVLSSGQVEAVKILELTCDRSYCINTKAFLSQFKSFNSANAKQAKYDAISGATYSTDLTGNIVRRALMLYDILNGNTNA